VKIRAMLLPCGLLLALASAASAQSVSSPPPSPSAPAAVEPPATPNSPAALDPPPPAAALNAPAPPSEPGMPPQRVVAMVRASGFDPIGRPVRHGNLYVQRAVDANAVEYRLVIDSLTGRTVSVRPIGMFGPYATGPAYGPYEPYPPYRRVFGRYFGPPSDDYGFGRRLPRPPRNVPQARVSPTQPSASAPQPSASAPQPGTTAQAPLPRPKPYVMEATGSIPADSPKAPQKSAETQKAPDQPKALPQHNGAAAMPPVAPLD
jgi:hypothetical protein